MLTLCDPFVKRREGLISSSVYSLDFPRIFNYTRHILFDVKPNVAYLCRGKTRKSASDVAAHRLGQVDAYLTVREVLSEASTAADGVL